MSDVVADSRIHRRECLVTAHSPRLGPRIVYIQDMNTKDVDGVTYTLTRRDVPGPDLGAWYWLGTDDSVLELEEAELRALRASETILDE